MSDLLELNGIDTLAHDVLQRLAHRFGSRFERVPEDDDRVLFYFFADVAFRDRFSGKTFVVHLAGTPSSGDLPLATIPHLRRIKEAVEPRTVVLVSVSPVSQLVRTAMDAYGIPIVEVAPGENGAAELAAVIADLVAE
jgi:hypothetical protein